MSGKQKRKKRRMTLPKKADDVQKIAEEVMEMEAHEHHHHHHHGGEIDEALLVIELLVDSLNATVQTLQTKIQQLNFEVAKLYRVLSYIVESVAAVTDSEKARALERARTILEK